MPKLNGFESYIKLAGSGLRLKEYDTFWASNVVECFVAIPNQRAAFAIYLSCNAYFSPGIAAYIFIDGVYQCNRMRRLLPPVTKPDGTVENSQVDLTFKAKEHYLDGQRQISHPWSFEKLNIGVLTHKEHDRHACRILTNLAPEGGSGNVNTETLPHLGIIEVVIVRCGFGASELVGEVPRSPKASTGLWDASRTPKSPTTSQGAWKSKVKDKDGRTKEVGPIGGQLDGPRDDFEDDRDAWRFDGRGGNPHRRREGHSRHTLHGRSYDYDAYDPGRRSGHRRNHTQRDWSSEDFRNDYESTDDYIDDSVPPDQRRSNYRRSHRQAPRAPSPPYRESREYPREYDSRRSGRDDRRATDPVEEAYQTGLRQGAEQARNTRTDEPEPRERRRRYRGESPLPPNTSTGPQFVINQQPGSGPIFVGDFTDPVTGERTRRVNMNPSQERARFEYVFYSDSDSDIQEDTKGEQQPPRRLRDRSGSPTPKPANRRDTGDSLYGRMKNLLTGYKGGNKSESGQASKRSSFHSYVEDAVDEELGGKPASGKDKVGERTQTEPVEDELVDDKAGKRLSNQSPPGRHADRRLGQYPMPGSYPSPLASKAPQGNSSPMTPKGFIEHPKRGFEAAIPQNKGANPQMYGKAFPPSSRPTDAVSWKELDPNSRISSWIKQTQEAFASHRSEVGDQWANKAADIGNPRKVSFDDRGRSSRNRSPHHNRGASHDRRNCNTCQDYYRHWNNNNNRNTLGNGGWNSNDQWNDGKSRHPSSNSQKQAKAIVGRNNQGNWSNNDQNNWNSNDQRNDGGNANQNAGWDNSNNNGSWDNNNSGRGNTGNDNNWDQPNNQSNGGWDNSNGNNNNWDSNQGGWDNNANAWATAPQPAANDWSNNPPPPANWGSKPPEPEKAKSVGRRSSHRTKEEIESISKPREYWHVRLGEGGNDGPSSPPNTAKKRSYGTTLPAEPLHTIPESVSKAKNIEHQVRAGEGTETKHAVGRPVYIDQLRQPFVVFRFRYRSPKCLEEILGEKITETPEELRGSLMGLSKEELIEEVMRRQMSGVDDGEGEKKEKEAGNGGGQPQGVEW